MGTIKKNDSADDRGERRRAAEAQLGTGGGGPPDEYTEAACDTSPLIRELQVHQIELELQNEELQNARMELEASCTRYADLYDFAPVGYLTLDRDGGIREMNVTAARLLQQDRSRLLGRRLGLSVAPECRVEFRAFLAEVFASGTTQVRDLLLHPDDGVASVAVELTATASQDGQECRVAAADITARKQGEQQRDQLRAQLMQSQKMEAIGTLAGGIAHDFNNLLHGILGGLSILELDQASTHRAEIQDMRALVQRGAELARQLLGFARHGKYDVKPLDLGVVLAKTSDMFGRTRKDVTLQVDVAPDLSRVLMDYSQLEQVLLNLLVNAGQAMADGGRIRLRAENVELGKDIASLHGVTPGRFVKLSVTDTGIGMDAVTQARIFEPFFTTRVRGQGTGLGLASVYGIVKGHDGFITVESQLKIGTTFTLCLPATDRAPSQHKVVLQPVERGHGTILIVDDEELILGVCSRFLRMAGYQVLTATRGKEAIAMVREHGDEISLVILDMIMPEMSGRQTFEELQRISPQIKVLLASGFSLEGQAQELLDLGCKGFIPKPFGLAGLSAKVREALSSPESPQAVHGGDRPGLRGGSS